MRVLFMGTPQLAVPVLKRIIASQHKVVAVVTQPDKPAGRHQRITSPPVKKLAAEEGIRVFQPLSLKDEELQGQLRNTDADIGVVFAYGKIIPQWLLTMPKHGLVNIHASLLPRWRGAAPIQRAVMSGDRATGITIMQVVSELDAGDILVQREIPIESEDTSGSITERVSDIGTELLIEALDKIENAELVPGKQDESLVTYAEKISEADLEINWGKTVETIYNQVRGLNPKPGAYTYFNGKKLKIWQVLQEDYSKYEPVKGKHIFECDEPGTTVAIEKNKGPVVKTGDGLLLLEEVQPENKKRINGGEFVRGYRIKPGNRFGKE